MTHPRLALTEGKDLYEPFCPSVGLSTYLNRLVGLNRMLVQLVSFFHGQQSFLQQIGPSSYQDYYS